MKNKDSYQDEILNTLKELNEKVDLPEFKYFLNCVKKHFLEDLNTLHPELVVVDTSFPEELILSAKRSYCILGGSRESTKWSDDLLPRDADPVTRSILGYLKRGAFKDALVLVPLINDNMRKLSYILRTEGLKVHPYYFPPLKNKASFKEWNRQYENCKEAISLHLKRAFNKRSFRHLQRETRKARILIRKFLELSQDRLTGTSRILVLNSYYCQNDLKEWNSRLESLIKALTIEETERNSANILLLGSPIYFPNYKVPFLIEETGLKILDLVDYSTLYLKNAQYLKRTAQVDKSEQFLSQDSSPAHITNDTLFKQIKDCDYQKKIDGVIYHVLKGQIEYDFELERFENLFEEMNIPVFRLETDYNYQDVEQLRIRLEAFAEVLNQRKYEGKNE